ncbi:MAG: hypothetical protein FJZ13_02140 [Candidatus Omnitrophica bacterium]|nr:hypothetical protein [Candidatus Omnitrophota bacterium]
MKDNTSPEEKLLKLIKKDKPASERTTLPGMPPDKKAAAGLAFLKSAIQNLLYFLRQKYLMSLYFKKAVMALLVISFLYLFISLIYPLIGLRRIKLPEISREKINLEEPEAGPKTETKPYEFYSQALNQRRIFSGTTAQGTIGASSVATPDLTKDLNLVGIISGVNPQAVIEDKNTQKTYYLSNGQFIGELQIEDIQEGKIILNYNGQRYELYL